MAKPPNVCTAMRIDDEGEPVAHCALRVGHDGPHVEVGLPENSEEWLMDTRPWWFRIGSAWQRKAKEKP